MSDYGLVKSYFVLRARSSASCRLVEVERTKPADRLRTQRAAQFFILIARDISKVAERCREKGERFAPLMNWLGGGRSVSLFPHPILP